MARIPVTQATVAAYLQTALTANNYQLFYGLHLLSAAQFTAIMDALLNGDCQPEELVRLGTYTSAEADAFIADVLGDWAAPYVSQPSVGTDGYQYMSETLGLVTMLQAIANPPVTASGPNPAAFLGVSYRAGAPGNSYSTAGTIAAIFQDNVLPAALQGNSFFSYFPSSPSDVSQYLLGSVSDPAAQALVQAWYSSAFYPLEGVQPEEIGTRLFAVNFDTTVPFAANPGLAQWVLAEPEVPPSARLLFLREAAVRTASGPYQPSDAQTVLNLLAQTSPTPVATSRTMAYIYFWANVMAAACAAGQAASPADPTWAELQPQFESYLLAYGALHQYMLNLRSFLNQAYIGAMANIEGSYPPA